MRLSRTRREFLAALAAAPVLLRVEPAATPVRIAPLSEPGEQILISGVVYQSDGITPAAGARIFAYHVDRFGKYSPATTGEPKHHARLKAYFSTDQQGRYAIATIRPASYPDSTISAHIHVHVAPKGILDAELFEYAHTVPNFLFEGDRFLDRNDLESARNLGRFNNIVRLAPSTGGRVEGVRHIRIGHR